MQKIARILVLVCTLLSLNLQILNSQIYHHDVAGNARISGRLAIGDTLNLNTFIGHKSGIAQAQSIGNTFVGYVSGSSNQSGSGNSFFGSSAGKDNVDGFGNSFFGLGSGVLNASGDHNSYFGMEAGAANTAGSRNAFFGESAGEDNVSSDNSFFGTRAGKENTSGSRNTIVGSDAGDALLSGSNNTLMGYKAQTPGTSSNNQIVIGYRADGQGNNTVTLGNEAITAVYMGEDGMASVVSSSDIRMKKDIKDSNLGLNFVNALRPVSYKWKNRSEFPKEFTIVNSEQDLEIDEVTRPLQHGLIAQEVKSTLKNLGIDWQGWHQNAKSGRQGLTYSALTVPLIKAVQELSQENETLKAVLKEHDTKIQTLIDHLDKL